MSLFCQGCYVFVLLAIGAAISPAKSGDLKELAIQPSGHSATIDKSINVTKLHDKIPPELWGFLKKEDRLHPHYHAGTKEEHAQRQASTTLELLRLFRPCAQCQNYRRYGSAHDGGYVMCDDLMQGVSAAYSFGINAVSAGNSSADWDRSISRQYDVPVYQFDCYHTERPTCASGGPCKFHFYPECLGLPDNSSRVFRSLEDHIQRHTPMKPGEAIPRGGDLLLKVDVEGKEWETFSDARMPDLHRMRQIVVEFHSISRVEFHSSFLDTMRRIHRAGFVVAHIHGNNYGPMALFGDGRFRLADDVEVTFVNTRAMPASMERSCRNTQEKLAQDSKNNPYNFDLPTFKLPGDDETILPSRIRVLRCRWWCDFYAIALRIGPFVLVSGFLLVLMITLGLLISTPRLKPLGKRKGSKREKCPPETTIESW